MEEIQTILAYSVAGNSVADWAVATGVFIIMFIALELFRKVLVTRLLKLAKKTHSKVDDVLSGFLHSIKWPVFFLVALFFALKGVEVPASIQLILDIAILVVIVWQVTRVTEEIACMLMVRHLRKTNSDATLPSVFRITIRLVLWSVGGLMVLSNAGVDITSLVAGLGIGGLAVSLALQNILSDLFSSFSLAVDKPFEIGDFIIVGDNMGTVKHIGLKTTRLTAIGGEELVISNAELTSARVQNFKKMQKRRILFNIGVTYDTTPEKLAKVNEIVEQAITQQENVEFARSHFFSFGDSALIFEVVYFMLTNDYNIYMEKQQAINLDIHKKFAEEGIEMAFPTQTVYVKKD